jgi:hypothetical protein
MRAQRRSPWMWRGVALAVALGATGYAFTATSTVPSTNAGDGSGTISGYVVSSVKYNLNSSNPGNIDSVTFTLDSTPISGSTIKSQLASAGSWYSCTNVAAAVTCTTTSPQATVAAATTLRVIVAQ